SPMCGVPYKRLVEGRIASQRHGQRKVPGLMPDQRLKLTGRPRAPPPPTVARPPQLPFSEGTFGRCVSCIGADLSVGAVASLFGAVSPHRRHPTATWVSGVTS